MKSQIPKSDETASEGPFFSFAHLGSCYPHGKTGHEDQVPAYGFIPPREEILYETGILFKSFMKC